MSTSSHSVQIRKLFFLFFFSLIWLASHFLFLPPCSQGCWLFLWLQKLLSASFHFFSHDPLGPQFYFILPLIFLEFSIAWSSSGLLLYPSLRFLWPESQKPLFIAFLFILLLLRSHFLTLEGSCLTKTSADLDNLSLELSEWEFPDLGKQISEASILCFRRNGLGLRMINQHAPPYCELWRTDKQILMESLWTWCTRMRCYEDTFPGQGLGGCEN